MQIERQRSRSGAPTLRVDGRFLHSPYNPQREADRFVVDLQVDHPEGLCILIGDGTGIAGASLVHKHPLLQVLLIHPADRDFAHLSFAPGTAESISAESPAALQHLLRTRIGVLDVRALQTTTWPGARTAIPDWTTAVERVVLAAIKDVQSELATTATFGRRWIANSLRRNVSQNTNLRLAMETPRLIAASSGPSLVALADWIPPGNRRAIPLVAASSAAYWLEYHGFCPSLVVHTDGGAWGDRYLRDVRRADLPTAVHLRAGSLPIPRALLFRTGWFGEQLAPDVDDWSSAADLPTVGASVLQLIHGIDPDTEIILAGFDVCSRDLQGHATPHHNDRFVRTHSERRYTEETIRADRVGWSGSVHPLGGGSSWWNVPAWQSDTLRIYQTVIRREIETHRVTGTVTFLEPSPAWPDEMRTSRTESIPPVSPRLRIYRRPARARRSDHSRSVLRRWREEIRSDLRLVPEELLLHLAPVEALRWKGKKSSENALRTAATKAVDTFLTLLEHFS